jgi:hypothetical protein
MLVFGGTTKMSFVNSDYSDICASYVDPETVPVAIYAAPTSLSLGGGSLQALSGCVVDPSCTTAGQDTLLVTHSNGHAAFHIEGYTYAPTAAIDIDYKNSDAQIFNWGVLTRRFALRGNGSSPSGAYIQLPKASFGVGLTYTTKYVNVYTCVASEEPCAASGTPDLRVKLELDTEDGSYKVLSWSHQR